MPPEQVVGSSIKAKFEMRNGEPVLVRLPEINFIDDKEGKPVGINSHIGRRPVAAFGNSDGDLQMLQWTTAGDGPRFALYVHHTDAQREWAYDRNSSVGKLDKGLDEAQAKGWTVVDMKRDWKVIFPPAQQARRNPLVDEPVTIRLPRKPGSGVGHWSARWRAGETVKNKFDNCFRAILGIAIMGCTVTAAAQGGGDAAAQANNPLANMTAFNLQNYYIGRLTQTDEDANQFWLRYAQPFEVFGGKWLMRASLPVNSYPTFPDGGTETGLGDLNAFAAYLIDTGDPALSFGFGPQVTAPSATEDALGSGKWSAGFANVLFNARSKKFQYGYLLTWQASFAGDDDREDVNIGAFQPFAFYQLGKGAYLRSAPVWAYNFENDAYSIPIGLGVGQVIPRGKTVFNLFVEPQYSVAWRGPAQPDWQIFAGFNMQFTH